MKNPHKKNHLEIKFTSVKYKVSSLFKYGRHKQIKYEKEMEIEAAFLAREIELYGFKFFPDHYVKEKIKNLEIFVSEVA